MGTHYPREEELKRRAQRAFRDQGDASVAERGIADEVQRKKDLSAKTACLRERRLAREEALASAKAKLVALPNGKRQPK